MIYCQNWFVVDVVECLSCGPDYHWPMICQNSCPQGVCEHHRSGSCSLSSSARTVSKDPRCRYRSSTSLAENAGQASLVMDNSYTMPSRFFPMETLVDVAG